MDTDIVKKLITLKTIFLPIPLNARNLITIDKIGDTEIAKLYFYGKELQFKLPDRKQKLGDGQNLRVYVLGLINIIFLQEEYKDTNFNVVGKKVVDIGSSVGDTAMYFVLKGATEVYGVESEQNLIDLAIPTITLNQMSDRIHIEKSGLTLKEILSKHKIKSGVTLKMDCEGCEYQMIAESDTETLRKFDSILMEYHNYPTIIEERLEEAGFIIEYPKKAKIEARFSMEDPRKDKVGLLLATKEN